MEGEWKGGTWPRRLEKATPPAGSSKCSETALHHGIIFLQTRSWKQAEASASVGGAEGGPDEAFKRWLRAAASWRFIFWGQWPKAVWTWNPNHSWRKDVETGRVRGNSQVSVQDSSPFWDEHLGNQPYALQAEDWRCLVFFFFWRISLSDEEYRKMLTAKKMAQNFCPTVKTVDDKPHRLLISP